MSKFHDILNRHGLLLEQPQESDVPPGTPTPEETAGAADASALPTQPPAAEQPDIANQPLPEAEVKKLSPESFVWLVTVLKNAFLAHPELDDQKKVAELKDEKGEMIEEVNPENAQKVLDTIWPIISKYMPSELKTYDLGDQPVKSLLQKAS